MKTYRQAAILELVSSQAVHSQDALRQRLATSGIRTTQATLSRDIKELGLVKRAADGAYQTAQAETPPRAVSDDRVRRAVVEYLRRADRVQQLLVIGTDPGQAQPLAFALDRAAWPEVVGTVAGDDTILVISRTERSARTLERRLERWAKGQ
jgi:transcriptional regulator of arginine metabolism